VKLSCLDHTYICISCYICIIFKSTDLPVAQGGSYVWPLHLVYMSGLMVILTRSDKSIDQCPVRSQCLASDQWWQLNHIRITILWLAYATVHNSHATAMSHCAADLSLDHWPTGDHCPLSTPTVSGQLLTIQLITGIGLRKLMFNACLWWLSFAPAISWWYLVSSPGNVHSLVILGVDCWQ